MDLWLTGTPIATRSQLFKAVFVSVLCFRILDLLCCFPLGHSHNFACQIMSQFSSHSLMDWDLADQCLSCSQLACLGFCEAPAAMEMEMPGVPCRSHCHRVNCDQGIDPYLFRFPITTWRPSSTMPPSSRALVGVAIPCWMEKQRIITGILDTLVTSWATGPSLCSFLNHILWIISSNYRLMRYCGDFLLSFIPSIIRCKCCSGMGIIAIYVSCHVHVHVHYCIFWEDGVNIVIMCYFNDIISILIL